MTPKAAGSKGHWGKLGVCGSPARQLTAQGRSVVHCGKVAVRVLSSASSSDVVGMDAFLSGTATHGADRLTRLGRRWQRKEGETEVRLDRRTAAGRH